MKKSALLIILFFTTVLVNAQTVSSSCSADASIEALYKDDADRLTVRKIYRQGLSYQDSIIIPQDHSDTILKALIAVYNATSLAARDTVVSMFDIHTFTNPSINGINISADSTLTWMEQLDLGNIPTGNTAIDDLLALYNLTLYSYSHHFNLFNYHTAVFVSENNYNLPPLLEMFQANPEVYYAESGGVIGDGNDITDSIYADHVELIYSLGWGDCPAGCTERRFWKFNVYFDCSVEFVESYGNPLQIWGTEETQNRITAVYPNPFKNEFTVTNSNDEETTLQLYDILGNQILERTFINSGTINTEQLESGTYFYKLSNQNGMMGNWKIVKY